MHFSASTYAHAIFRALRCRFISNNLNSKIYPRTKCMNDPSQSQYVSSPVRQHPDSLVTSGRLIAVKAGMTRKSVDWGEGGAERRAFNSGTSAHGSARPFALEYSQGFDPGAIISHPPFARCFLKQRTTSARTLAPTWAAGLKPTGPAPTAMRG